MNSAYSFRMLLAITALLFSTVTSDGKDPSSDNLVGTWTKSSNERTITFTIMSDYKYTVEFVGDAEIDVKGSYVISGTQITFNDDAGDYSSVEPGVYEFEVNESSVKFTKVNDPAYGRSMLVEGSWSKTKVY